MSHRGFFAAQGLVLARLFLMGDLNENPKQDCDGLYQSFFVHHLPTLSRPSTKMRTTNWVKN
jgi:hypothetical protein